GDDQFPFSYPTLSDPISGRSDGILQRARDAGVCPKVLHLDTESDLWQARSSLVATDTRGADIAMPEEVRVYTISGVSHAPFRPLSKPVIQLPGNRLGYGAFMRAAGRAVRMGGARPRTAGQPVSVARRWHIGAGRRGACNIPQAAESDLPERFKRAETARSLG